MAYKQKKIKEILEQVPVDYYQKGIQYNIFQRYWHTKKLFATKSLIADFQLAPKNILDVGCASGWFLSQLKKNYPASKCTGIDLYKKAIVYGRKVYPSLRLINSDAHSIPFPKSTFDLVICTEVLEHVTNPEKVLYEIKRVLRKDGVAIIEMDSGNFLFRVLWYLWTNLPGNVWKDAHIHLFNTEKLENLIIKSGLAIEKKKIFNWSMAITFGLKKN